ncbi:MAG TPA: 30S ribosomal protein S18 [Candidatus Latescibacteria bacterium]|nr:30S ribosomal protein S18 [Candidatus Latescibacterota bacterium]
MQRKICWFCANNDEDFDYRDERKLRRFITERGKIIPRRVSGVCARHQRKLGRAVKKARHLAILPYASEMFR